MKPVRVSKASGSVTIQSSTLRLPGQSVAHEGEDDHDAVEEEPKKDGQNSPRSAADWPRRTPAVFTAMADTLYRVVSSTLRK